MSANMLGVLAGPAGGGLTGGTSGVSDVSTTTGVFTSGTSTRSGEWQMAIGIISLAIAATALVVTVRSA